MEKPEFNRQIFWGVDYEKLDFDQNAAFIIERVFNRGDVEDIRRCRKYYNQKLVVETLLNAKHLSKYRLYLASAVIDHPLNDFRCYINRQSKNKLSPY
ncbi:MAG: hypothetical protein AAGF85_13130 [Bacteroidota bacterium]